MASDPEPSADMMQQLVQAVANGTLTGTPNADPTKSISASDYAIAIGKRLAALSGQDLSDETEVATKILNGPEDPEGDVYKTMALLPNLSKKEVGGLYGFVAGGLLDPRVAQSVAVGLSNIQDPQQADAVWNVVSNIPSQVPAAQDLAGIVAETSVRMEIVAAATSNPARISTELPQLLTSGLPNDDYGDGLGPQSAFTAAQTLTQTMSDADYQTVESLLNQAKSPAEKQAILKAVALGSNVFAAGQADAARTKFLSDLTNMAAEIRGQSAAVASNVLVQTFEPLVYQARQDGLPEDQISALRVMLYPNGPQLPSADDPVAQGVSAALKTQYPSEALQALIDFHESPDFQANASRLGEEGWDAAINALAVGCGSSELNGGMVLDLSDGSAGHVYQMLAGMDSNEMETLLGSLSQTQNPEEGALILKQLGALNLNPPVAGGLPSINGGTSRATAFDAVGWYADAIRGQPQWYREGMTFLDRKPPSPPSHGGDQLID